MSTITLNSIRTFLLIIISPSLIFITLLISKRVYVDSVRNEKNDRASLFLRHWCARARRTALRFLRDETLRDRIRQLQKTQTHWAGRYSRSRARCSRRARRNRRAS